MTYTIPAVDRIEPILIGVVPPLRRQLPAIGPWRDEPDRLVWRDDATGLSCLINRGPTGALCGYVGVLSDHPLHGVSARDAPVLDCHGGLTFAGALSYPGTWFLGFDCSHYGDSSPASCVIDGEYRDLEYVIGQVERLARQVKAVRS